MIFRLFILLVGYAQIKVANRREALLTLFLRKRVNVAMGRPKEGGGYSFVVPLYEQKKLLRLLDAYNFPVDSVQTGGLPVYLWSFRKRVGLILGILSAATVITAGSLVLWNVRIVGCETVSVQEARELLTSEGIEVGGFIPPIDAKVSASRIVLRDPRIAYVAINIIGTVCEVQVTEAKFADDTKEKYPADIVAAYDGLIERVELYDGQTMVTHGEAVRKGQVLISGLCESGEGVWRLESASGVVIAKVEREFCVEVPLTEEVTVQTRAEPIERSLIFFKKSIKLSKSSSIFPSTYGTIVKKEEWALPGGITLPIALQTVSRVGYETVVRHRTYAEAEALAEAKMESLVANALQDAQLLTLTQTMEHTETGVRLTWQVYCLMDIGESLPLVGVPR